MKFAIDVAPFDELADPRLLAELAATAEERGWDGFFVWDHIVYRAPVQAVLDPWVALAAIACATSRVRIGTMITPLSRRRVHKLARETVTLDQLSAGRLTLGVGIGSARNNELEPFGEVADPRERAVMLDEGLAQLTRYWSGDFQPVPVQQPRIPVWVAAEWPHRRPVRRAARWDGLFPTRVPSPADYAELLAGIRAERADRAGRPASPSTWSWASNRARTRSRGPRPAPPGCSPTSPTRPPWPRSARRSRPARPASAYPSDRA